MKNKSELTLIILIFLSFFCFIDKVNSQDNTFFRKYNLYGMQGGLQLAVTSDGGFIATGQHEGNGGNGDCDIYVYKLDVCGNIEWFNIFGTTAQEGGRSIQQTDSSAYRQSADYCSYDLPILVGIAICVAKQLNVICAKLFEHDVPHRRRLHSSSCTCSCNGCVVYPARRSRAKLWHNHHASSCLVTCRPILGNCGGGGSTIGPTSWWC